MTIGKPRLWLVDDPVGETMALLDDLPFPILVVLLIVVASRAVEERALTPAGRLWLLNVIRRVLFLVLDQAA
jgi:hypothetical protein